MLGWRLNKLLVSVDFEFMWVKMIIFYFLLFLVEIFRERDDFFFVGFSFKFDFLVWYFSVVLVEIFLWGCIKDFMVYNKVVMIE